MAWNLGQQLQGGKYTIDRVLGVGGFGITYLAFQNSRRNDQKTVVIKTLKDELRLDPKWANYQIKLQQDFLNEALKLAKCHHPHIVAVQEIIREGYFDCIVMELVEGESLEQHLSNSLRRGSPLPEAVLIDFGLAREFMQDSTQTHSLALTHGFAPLEQYNQKEIRSI